MTQTPATTDIAALRAFNRLYTQKLGLLNPRLDDSPFTLTEARILYELANRDAPVAAEIMRELGLDRAQLSRTLKRFEARGLLTSDVSPDGGRRRPLTLTVAGRETFAALEHNTVAAIGGLLGDLPSARRAALLAATETIRGIFSGAGAGEVVLRDPKPGDLGWIIHRQAVLYADEYGWNQDYEALVAQILSDFSRDFDPAKDAAWVAELDGRVVGSVFLVRGDTAGEAKLRLLYVEPSTRGLGIGARLVAACIAKAKSLGYRRLTLWTNSVLASARRIYQAAGFILTGEEAHHSFGHDLVGQTWMLDLTQKPLAS